MKPILVFAIAFAIATAGGMGASIAMQKSQARVHAIADSAIVADSTSTKGERGDVPEAPAAVSQRNPESVTTVIAATDSNKGKPKPVTDMLDTSTRPAERRLAKVFSVMAPREAAKVLEHMSDRDVETILGYVGPKQAAAILTAIEPERAAALSKSALRSGGDNQR